MFQQFQIAPEQVVDFFDIGFRLFVFDQLEDIGDQGHVLIGYVLFQNLGSESVHHLTCVLEIFDEVLFLGIGDYEVKQLMQEKLEQNDTGFLAAGFEPRQPGYELFPDALAFDFNQA